MYFQAEAFIIPNKVDTFKKENHLHLNAKLARWGIVEKFQEEESIIQLWITSDESDSWADHGAPKELFNTLEPTGKNYFPQYFPYSIFKDKKEGETITILLDGKHELNLTLAQTKYRYKSFGNFEDALSFVIR